MLIYKIYLLFSLSSREKRELKLDIMILNFTNYVKTKNIG